MAPLLTALAAAGCGTDEYEQRLKLRVQDIQFRAPFEAALEPPQPIGDSPVLVRVPKQPFGRAKPIIINDIKEMLRQGAWPPTVLLGLPMLVYKGTVADSANGQYPYYFGAVVLPRAAAEPLRNAAGPGREIDPQVAKVPTPRGWSDRMDASGAIYVSVRHTFRKFKGNWTEEEFDTPTGQKLAWQRLTVLPADGEQPFNYLDSNGQPSVRKMPGVLEILRRSGATT